MKRYGMLLCAALLLAGPTVLMAASTTLSVEPSQMKDGETKSFTDNDRTITVRRAGNVTEIRIEGADETDKLSITREGSRIRIGWSVDEPRGWMLNPERRRIIVDGFPLPDLENLPKFRALPPTGKAMTWFTCPKDKTVLRVPEGKADQTFQCPVDGTTMEKRKGRGFTLFFEDDLLESTTL